MRRAIARVGGHDHVLVDGNRIAGFEAQVGPYSNIVDGDAKVYSIACASVVAKVVRDRMMERLAARYPGYGWERNQGYATLEHRLAIRELGLTPFHRRSFLALQRTLAGDQLSLDLLGGSGGVGRDPRAARARAGAGHGRRRDARRPGPRLAGVDGTSRKSADKGPAATMARMADRPDDPTRTPAQQAGDAAETLVAARLADAGWTVLARNVHVGRHELDLVAVDPGPPAALVIVEVRWRAGRDVRPAGGDGRSPQAGPRSVRGVRAAGPRARCRMGRPCRGCRCGSTWSWSSRATGSGTTGTPCDSRPASRSWHDEPGRCRAVRRRERMGSCRRCGRNP